MEEIILKNIRENQLIQKGDNIVLGVSGGPDSMALLYLLKNIQEKLNFNLFLAHINHGVRGEEALRDQNFVKRKAEELNLPFYLKKADMIAYGKERGISSEEAGREIRYGFFNEILTGLGGGKIAVAHNKNDQAETIIMRIIRGAGIDGLRGMDFISGNIIRPILNIDRLDIEDYIEKNQIETVLDKTNLQSIYTRNKIRLEVIPYLEENFNPNIIEGLWRLTRTANIDSNFLEKYSKNRYNLLLKKKAKDYIILDGKEFENQDISIKQRILRRAILELNKNLQGIGEDHIRSVLELFHQGNTGKEVHLPNEILVRLDYKDLLIRKGGGNIQEDYEFKLIEGTNDFKDQGFRIHVSVLDKDQLVDIKDSNSKYFDYDKIKGQLQVRNRRNGDRFRPLGMTGSKKLKDYFIDEKISRDLRDKIPLIMDDNNIIWIIGYRISDTYKVDKHTKRILRLEYYSYKKEEESGEGY